MGLPMDEFPVRRFFRHRRLAKMKLANLCQISRCEEIARIVTIGSFTLVFFITNIWLARFDVEGFHDGYSLAPAIAVSEGLIPNRDVSYIYGFLSPLIQGFWLKLTGATLLNLRLLNAILVTFNFALSLLVLSRRWSLSLSVLAVSCVAFAYTSILPVMIPWPSVLLNTILVILVYFHTSKSEHKYLQPYILWSVTGFLLSTAFFLRIHAIFIVLLLALCLFLTKNFFSLLNLIVSFLSTSVLYILILGTLGALPDFVKDVFLYPRELYANEAVPWQSHLVNIFLLLSYFGFLLFLLGIHFLQKIASVRRTRKLAVVPLCTTIIVFIFTFLNYQFGLGIEQIPINQRSFLNFEYFGRYFAQNMRFLLVYSLAAFLMYSCSQILINGQMRLKSNLVVPFAFSIGSLAQLLPSPDYLHLWWISPVLIMCISCFLDGKTMDFLVWKAVLLGVLFTNLIFLYSTLSQDRFYIKDTVARGMYGLSSQIPDSDLLESLRAIDKYFEEEKGYFHCRMGIYSVANGDFLSKSKDFVSWGFQTQDKVDLPGLHFYCDSELPPLSDKEKLIWVGSSSRDFILRREE
jgi:hypothetical protein